MSSVDDLLSRHLDAAYERMVELRHDIHAHPELSNDEFRTTAVIVSRLEELGWEIRPCPTPTGAVARLNTGRPGHSVMLRADIDALPVEEEVPLAYRSTVPGVMHACGHDVHTAALLGVAELLSRGRDQLGGSYTVVFQPAEEMLGGALAMIEGGLLRDNPCDAVLGVHVASVAPLGLVSATADVAMSQALGFRVELRGSGGHGAMASREGNVVLAVGALALRLHEVVEGLSYLGTDCACSAGVVRAGTAANVVPRDALLQGTLRTFTQEQHVTALARLHQLVDTIGEEYAVSSEFVSELVAPAVRNDSKITAIALAAARETVGDAGALSLPPVTPSDDVSELLDRVPGCYLLVGGGLADGSSGMHHSGDFAVADESLKVIAEILLRAATRITTP